MTETAQQPPSQVEFIPHYDMDGGYIRSWEPGRYPSWDLSGAWIQEEPVFPPLVDPDAPQMVTGIDHMDFGVKVQIVSKIFEYTSKAYYGELFPLFAKLFARVDAIAEQGLAQLATPESLATLQVQSLVEATMAAVQVPKMVDLANASLSVGPSNPVSGPQFFTAELLNKDVSLLMFSGVSKATYYSKYKDYESRVIDEIADGALDMLGPTGVSIIDPVALRSITAATMPVVPRNEGSTGVSVDDSLTSARAFIAAKTYEKFCAWYTTMLLLPALRNLFQFYKEYPGQWALITELIASWIIRDAGRYAVSDEAGMEYFTRISNYTASLEERAVYAPPLPNLGSAEEPGVEP